MKNMRNGLKGLSFIEVLITVFIIGIIILGLVNVL
uniref:Prepilin-type N-terminal cleavage/methylation domain-containing protein n=2 Tax=Dictyoglomus thermophilum TaxID=14 RepID=A0A7C3PSS3_DICTH